MKIIKMNKQLVGIKELAQYLNTSVAFVRKLVLTQQVPYFKIGGSVKFDLIEINQWIDEQKVEKRKSVLFI